MVESTIVNAAGEHMVQRRTAEAKKQCYTVRLAVTADGQKLPHYVVF
jgi:hypothetical protein